jgi:hypothetical protein
VRLTALKGARKQAAHEGSTLTRHQDDGSARGGARGRPEGADDVAVRAAGKVTEALETLVRQRLTTGRRHVFEAARKEQRSTHPHQAHRAAPTGSTPESTKE